MFLMHLNAILGVLYIIKQDITMFGKAIMWITYYSLIKLFLTPPKSYKKLAAFVV